MAQHEVRCQNYLIKLSIGNSNYNQNIGLNKFDNEIVNLLEKININSKISDNYPSYIHYSFELLYKSSPYIFQGISYRFQSTGSSIFYEDYTGNIKIKNRLISHFVSYTVVYRLSDFFLIPKFRNSFGILFNNFSTIYTETVYRPINNENSTKEDSNSSFNFEPTNEFGISWEVGHSNYFSSVYVNYLIAIPLNIDLNFGQSGANPTLIHISKSYKLNPSGLNFGISFGYTF